MRIHFKVTTIFYPILLIIFVLAIIPFFINDPENKTLNDATRKNLDGSFIRLPTGVTHYQLCGSADAPVVVLIHGFTEPYYIWDRNFDELCAAGYQVLRYDLYGRGFSDRPSGRYDVELFERQLIELLDALHLKQPINITGISMGGAIAAKFAVDYPQRIKTIVLFAPAGLPKPISWQRHLLKIPLLGNYFMKLRSNALLKPDGSDFAHPENFLEWPEKFNSQMEFKGFRHAILQTLRNFDFYAMENTFVQLGKLHKPILLFWGEQDTVIPFDTHIRIIKLLPNVTFFPVPESGHLSIYEGANFINPKWISFLKQHNAPQQQ